MAVAVVVVVVAVVVVVVMVVAGPQKRPEQAGIRAKPQRERPNEGPHPTACVVAAHNLSGPPEEARREAVAAGAFFPPPTYFLCTDQIYLRSVFVNAINQ